MTPNDSDRLEGGSLRFIVNIFSPGHRRTCGYNNSNQIHDHPRNDDDFMEYYISLLTLYGSLVGSLLITMPLTGTLVRLRANFNPISIRLDVDGGVEAQRPSATSFSGMLARVKRIEGWNGLFKGLLPLLIEATLLFVFNLYVLKPEGIMYCSGFPSTGLLGTLVYLIVALLLDVPAISLAYRAMVTPHRLSYFRPLQSLRVLLSPTERHRPWIIYTTPGLFTALFLRVVTKIIFFGAMKKLVLGPSDAAGGVRVVILGPTAAKFMLALLLFSTIILCPLEVATSKLAVQRNHTGPEYSTLIVEEAEGGDCDAYSGLEGEVVRLRPHDQPYLGLWDCLNKVIAEEGWTALLRAWWLTALGLFVG